jgi:mannose-6-phosphate isomerase-like protein (cupin superfamily)
MDAIVVGPGEGEVVGRKPERSITIKATLEQLIVCEYRWGPRERGPDPHVHHHHADAFYVGERLERGDRTVTIKGEVEQLSLIELEFDPSFTVEPHRHSDHTDAFWVLDGEVDFTVGDNVVRAGPGACVAARPGSLHGFRGADAGRARVLNLHAPDAGFVASVRSQ